MTTVVVTLGRGSLAGLAEELRPAGVRVLEQPLIRFGEPPDWGPVDAAIGRLAAYDAVVFTSPRAARSFALRLLARGITPYIRQAWASGEATRAALGPAWPGRVRIPDVATGEGAARDLAAAMLAAGLAGPVLFPTGDVHREELPRVLRAAGIMVDEVVCYHAFLAADAEALAAARAGEVLVVGSPRVMELLGRAVPADRPLLVVIGPTTAAAAVKVGWMADAVAEEVSASAVARAVDDLL
ncbi:MAG: uroporphyrinogen-III synthase [Gemmatimonadota bacterium]